MFVGFPFLFLNAPSVFQYEEHLKTLGGSLALSIVEAPHFRAERDFEAKPQKPGTKRQDFETA